MSLSPAFAGSVAAVAGLQGALVALPRQDALSRLAGLRSPRWALVLPGLIVIGTFGLVLIPSGATALIIAAAIVTPVLAVLAAVAVVRRRLATGALLLIAVAAVCAGLCHGIVGELCASLITACGAALAGAVIVALIPPRWLLVSIAVMCILDLVLMSVGVGRMSSALLDQATRHFHGPTFDSADVGTIVTEYPDLLLAAVIGALVAGRPQQRAAALLVTGCVGGYDLLLLTFHSIPATPPLGIALVLSQFTDWLSRRPQAANRSAIPGGSGQRVPDRGAPAVGASAAWEPDVIQARQPARLLSPTGARRLARRRRGHSTSRRRLASPASRRSVSRRPLVTEMSITAQAIRASPAEMAPSPAWTMPNASRRISDSTSDDRPGSAAPEPPLARITASRRPRVP